MSAYRDAGARGLPWPQAARPASWWRRWNAARRGVPEQWAARARGLCWACRLVRLMWHSQHPTVPSPPWGFCARCHPPKGTPKSTHARPSPKGHRSPYRVVDAREAEAIRREIDANAYARDALALQDRGFEILAAGARGIRPAPPPKGPRDTSE